MGCLRVTESVRVAIRARARLANSTAPLGVLYVLVQRRCAARIDRFGGDAPLQAQRRGTPAQQSANRPLPREVRSWAKVD